MLVKELREHLGKTRREFAIDIDSTEQSVGRWESSGLDIGARSIHPIFRKQMEKIAKRHKIDVSRDCDEAVTQ